VYYDKVRGMKIASSMALIEEDEMGSWPSLHHCCFWWLTLGWIIFIRGFSWEERTYDITGKRCG
jgi:hypothetical protein